MIRTMGIMTIEFALFPFAALLFLLGNQAISIGNKRGLWLKLALVINSLLLLIPSYLGCCGKPGGRVTCYDVAMSDFTEIPDDFDKSADWVKLENAMVEIEYQIGKGIYNEETEKQTREIIGEAVSNLKKDGLITEDEKILLWAYCLKRVNSYADLHVSCYTAMPSPGTKEGSKKEIIEATIELRQLYADGKINTPAYETSLVTLEDQLALYTGKEDNTVLRQLLLDLADGMGGAYY